MLEDIAKRVGRELKNGGEEHFQTRTLQIYIQERSQMKYRVDEYQELQNLLSGKIIDTMG